MKVFLDGGKKNVNINEQKTFLASGGEGSIFRIGGICYKIYTDISKVVPESKIRELMDLNDGSEYSKRIVAPTDLIRDQQTNTLIGYTMNFVDGDALCRLFNTSFLDDNKITNQMMVDLTTKMVETIQFIHDKGCLFVDGNEMNYMVNNTFDMPYFIDVNAWKTKSFPPSAMTPIFRDHSTKEFNELTDWYSFGIVVCKLFVGIHPYKGNHPNYGRKIDDVLKRMKDGVSIFNKEVSLPSAARDFDFIPDEYRKWFIDIFESGKRIPPPNVVGYVTVVKKQITTMFKYFTSDIYKLSIHPEGKDVKRFYKINNIDVAFCDDDIVIGDGVSTKQQIIHIKDTKTKIGVLISPKLKESYLVFIKNGVLNIHKADTKKKLDFEFSAKEFIIHDSVIYAYNNGKITQIVCLDINNNQTFSIGESWDATFNSTRVFGNCFYMSVMGKSHFLYPNISLMGKYFLRLVRVQEVDGYEVIEAKNDGNVLVVVGFKNENGVSFYDRFTYIFDKLDDHMNHIKDVDIGNPYINFIVLDNGIAVSMDEDGTVTIFGTNDVKNYKAKTIHDDSIKKNLRLFKDGTKVLFTDGPKIYHLKVTKTS